ncbi:hypothetical protein GR254_24755, partial [Mycobacterium tuberculosis]|nr:hypothetical protein [Mycobacterium tuberculosis]
KPDGPREGGYQLAVIRHGQLAAAGRAPRGVPPMPVVDAIRRGAQAILPTPAPQAGRPQGGRLPTGRHSPRPTRRCRQGTARGSS